MPAKAEKRADSAKNVESAVQARPPQKGDHVFLVDGSSYIFRAYHALPPLHRKSDGLQVNAVLGFCNMLWKLLRDMKPEERPTHLAVVFDKSEKTFRNEMYSEYKANRTEPPDDLRPQFAFIREAVHAFDLPCLEQIGFEADDLIATYVRLACEAGASATIVSSDKDLMQLVNDCVVMYDTMKDRRIGVPEVVEKFGVPPEKVIEVQSLIGNSTDNVPGVPGIGVKTAAQLIGEYGDLETLLARACEIKQEKRRQALIDNADRARLSKRLVTLDDHVTLDVPLADLAVHEPDYKRLIAFLKAMEFSTLTRRVAEFSGVEATQIDADGKLSSVSAARAKSTAAGQTGDLFPSPRLSLDDVSAGPSQGRATAVEDVQLTPQALATARVEAARNAKVDRSRYEIVRSLERLNAWVARARDRGVVALDTQTNSLDPMQATLCGFSLAVAPNEACYVPLAHRQGGDGGGDGLFAGPIAPDQIEEPAALAALKPLLEDPGVLKVGQDLKYDLQIFALRGIELGPYDDVMLMSYVLDAGRGSHGTRSAGTALLRSRQDRLQRSHGIGKIARRLRLRRYRQGRRIRCRERRHGACGCGMCSSRGWLPSTSRRSTRRWSARWCRCSRAWSGAASRSTGRCCRGCPASSRSAPRALEAEIQTLAGEPLNPGSPKQLGDILFGKMGLPGGTKTKTGQWSTGARVLDELAEQGHELPRKILDWRQVSKLKSTYTDALPGYVNATHPPRPHQLRAGGDDRPAGCRRPSRTCRTFRSAPRKAARSAAPSSPTEGHKLVSADYSQIELRLLAEIADIARCERRSATASTFTP